MALDHCMQLKEKACNHLLVLALKLVPGKCGNVTVDNILPSRSTIKTKLDDKCKLVKANLAEVQKAIADYG